VYGQYDRETVPEPNLSWPKRVYRILVAAGKEFGEDKGTRLAAALSYYTLFALVPLLFLSVALLGFVSDESTLTRTDCSVVTVVSIPEESPNPLDRALLQVEEVAGRQIADQLAMLTCQASAQRSGFLLLGLALAAFSGSGIFLHLQGVLNFLFHVPEERVRGLGATLLQRGVALIWALLLAIVAVVPMVAVAGLEYLRRWMPVRELAAVLNVIVPLVSLILLVVVVTVTFKTLTRGDVPWRAARHGGTFTALVGLAGAFLVGLYLREFGGGGALAAIGGVAILLFFFNLMWTIYVFGAEVTKVYADYLAYGDIAAPSERSAPLAVGAEDGEAAARESDAPESPWRTGIIAFLIGLVTGWAARRRA